MATTTQAPVDTLNLLLRGELSAVETYRQAEEAFQGRPEAAELRRIAGEHRESADVLHRHVLEHGGQPSPSSGVWGTFANLVQRAAKALGDTTMLKALKEGEEHGIKDYEKALREGELTADCRLLIQGALLPRCQAHVRALERMMEKQ
jgi:uncharacterized protein (TIGR02284 family)